MDTEYFAAGLSFVNDTVYQLTYKSNKILVWSLGNEEPKLDEMHIALIRVIDQTRMLDQDLIRLQQKVDVVLEYRARQQVINEAKENDKE